MSQYLVPQGSYVRIPLAAGQKGCLKICQCSAQGVVEHCQPMPCYPLDSCWLGNRKIGKQLQNSMVDIHQMVEIRKEYRILIGPPGKRPLKTYGLDLRHRYGVNIKEQAIL